MPKTSPDQIEIAAQALRDHVAGRVADPKMRRPWKALPETLKQAYRDEVEIVAAALR